MPQMPRLALIGFMWIAPLAAWIGLRSLLGGVWVGLYNDQSISEIERYWIARSVPANDLLAAILVLAVCIWLYRHRLYDRLATAVPIVLVAIATAILGFREYQRLVPYREYYSWLDLSQTADLVVVIAVPLGLALTIIAAFSPVGLGRRRIPLWRRGEIVRAATSNYGTADWMTLAEARRRLPAKGGIVIGEAYRVDEDRKAKVPFNPQAPGTWGKGGKAPLLEYACDTSSTHGLVFAGSGGFKTTSVAVPTLLRWPHSIITLDPSSELAPMTAHARRETGRKTIEIDPSSPETGGFNVLNWIDTTAPDADTNVASVVSWIAGDKTRHAGTAGGDFFASMGRALVTCLLSDLVFDPDLPREERTLRTFRERLTASEKAVKKHLHDIHKKSASYQARDLAGSLMDMQADETFSGIYTNAADLTNWLSTRNYAELVSGRAFSTDELIAGNLDLYLNIPLKTLDATPALARVIVGALLNAVYEAQGAIPHRFLFLLDEAFRLKHMAFLETARDAGRKYGITLVMLYQSLGQLEEQFGKGGKRAWYDSAAWRAYAAVQDPETAEELSKICGSYGVVQTSETRSTGANRRAGQVFAGSSAQSGENVSTTKRALVTVDEILHDMRADEQIVIVPGGRPIRCGRAIYFRRDDMKVRVDRRAFA